MNISPPPTHTQQRERTPMPTDLEVDVALVVVKLLRAGEEFKDGLHQWLAGERVAVRPCGHLGHQRVALAELGLEVLRTAQALELTVDHDGHARAQRVALLHAARHGNNSHTPPCCKT